LLRKNTLEKFSETLGSNAPAPGGGSVSALAGSLGADLISMVCSLSVDLPEFSDHQAMLGNAQKEAQMLSGKLMILVDLDTEAFNAVMKAYKMPKDSDLQKTERKKAIQEGFKQAVQSPLETAENCLKVLKLAETLISRINLNALSDFGVGAQMAKAGLEGAVMNIRINLPSIKDQEYVKSKSKKANHMLEEGDRISETTYKYVNSSLGGS